MRTERHIADNPPSLLPIRRALAVVYDDLAAALRSLQVHPGATLLQGCLPLLLHEAAETLRQQPGAQIYSRFLQWQREMGALNLWYALAMQQILGELKRADIPVMVLKGADLAATLYPQPDLRYFDDVDLLIHPQHLAQTAAILERLGYSYHHEYRFEAISTQRAGFVYAKTSPAGYLVFEIHTALHANEFGMRCDVQELWARARPVTIQGVEAMGMGLEDLLLYLCWHYRTHAFSRLIWLYDIALLLSTRGQQLDWPTVYGRARQQGVLTTLSYVLSWCHHFWLLPLPVAPLPPVSRVGQYFIVMLLGQGVRTGGVLRRQQHVKRKLLQYLLADTFPTLCLALFHVLVPTPTHLGRRYMEESRLPLYLFWLYYFLHPFIVVRQILQGAMQAIHMAKPRSAR